MEKLTDRQDLFCRCYLQIQNPREAALRAGFSPEEAEAEGLRLLGTPRVRRHLAKLRRLGGHPEERAALAGLRRLAFSPVGDCLRLLLFYPDLEEAQVQALDLFMLSEVKKTKDGGMEMKFFDRMKALEKLLELEDGAQGNDGLAALYKALENAGPSARGEDAHD